MRTVNLTSAKGGMNRLRTKGGAAAEVLYDLHNGYVTAARTCRSRPGTVIDAQLPPGTKGLCTFNGGFVVFATEPVDIPDPRYSCEVISHPEDRSIGLREIHFAGPFLGYLYVVAEFADGSVYHYWLQRGGQWKPNTVYREGDIVEPTVPNGIAYRARRVGPAYPKWAPNVERSIGDRVEPTAANGYFYEVVNTLSPDDDDPPAPSDPAPGGPGGGGDFAFTGTLPDAYVGVPYYNRRSLGDAWGVTGGDHVPMLAGTLPPGFTIEKGEQNEEVNVYAVPLEAGSFAVEIASGHQANVFGPHTQALTVHPTPAYGVLDALKRQSAAILDAHTAKFGADGRVLGLATATAGLLYAEVTITGTAKIGVHGRSLDTLAIDASGNPVGTFGLERGPGTYAIVLKAATGQVWISDASGDFTGDPAAGTGEDGIAPLQSGSVYRVAANGVSGSEATVAFNFGNSAWAYAPPAGYAGWPLMVGPVPVMWSSNGAYRAEVGTHNSGSAYFPPASEAGVLDYLRGAPAPDEWVGLAASFGKSAGKWQFEIKAVGDVPRLVVGLVKAGFDFAAKKAIGFEGAGDSIGVAHALRDASTGVTWTEVHTSLGGAHTVTRTEQELAAVYTFACDFDAGAVDVYRNGVLLQAITGLPSGEWLPAMSGGWWPTAYLTGTNLAHPVAGFNDWTTTV